MSAERGGSGRGAPPPPGAPRPEPPLSAAEDLAALRVQAAAEQLGVPVTPEQVRRLGELLVRVERALR